MKTPTQILFVILIAIGKMALAQNLALNKTATQSSDYLGEVAERAVDGNANGDRANGSVTHTQLETDPWWRLDLGQEYEVSEIHIYNRTDCCTDRLDGANILLGTLDSTDPGDYTIVGVAIDAPQQTINGNNTLARYLMVYLPGVDKTLSLAEVEVYGSVPTGQVPLTQNLALYKNVSQSSDYNGEIAEKAVDGITDGNRDNGSVTHTEIEDNPWWRVDLGQEYGITEVRIYNRTDCCSDRLDGASILLGTLDSTDPNDYTTLGIAIDAPEQTINAFGTVARYIMVYLPRSNDILSLAEVEVYGSGIDSGGNSVWNEANTIASYSGKVQVGDRDIPSDYKMAIDGKLITEEVKVQISGDWPDYVFAKGYDLPTLKEIQAHILEKGHLPNIPSAREVEANGLELGEMNKLLLEKIEELTLYILAQEKTQKSLEKRIEVLET
ncbi:MAG: discoidin domain-containing protein, partial [Bacteroidota bacterium]